MPWGLWFTVIREKHSLFAALVNYWADLSVKYCKLFFSSGKCFEYFPMCIPPTPPYDSFSSYRKILSIYLGSSHYGWDTDTRHWEEHGREIKELMGILQNKIHVRALVETSTALFALFLNLEDNMNLNHLLTGKSRLYPTMHFMVRFYK